MSGKVISIIGWAVIGAIAFAWEMLGVFGWDGFFPLTWILRDVMNAFWPVTLGMIVFWVWLGYHFFQDARTHH